jgi:hypothetical protein
VACRSRYSRRRRARESRRRGRDPALRHPLRPAEWMFKGVAPRAQPGAPRLNARLIPCFDGHGRQAGGVLASITLLRQTGIARQGWRH